MRAMQRMQFHAKSAKNDLKPTDFLTRTSYCQTEGVYAKKILLPYKNTIGKTRKCYVLSVITPFFVNCTSICVNFEKIKVIIYESIHFKQVIKFIPYSLRTSQLFSLIQRSFLPVHFQAIWKRRWQTKEGLGVRVLVRC